MGLGIHMLAEVDRSGLLGGAPPEGRLTAVADALCAAAVRAFPELAAYAAVAPGEDSEVLVRLHPADEELHISAHGARILLSARTNGGGPGYHAFLVSLMDEVADEQGLSWLPEFVEGDGEFNDETDYFVSRQVDTLQAEMATWLAAIARHMSADADTGSGHVYMVSMAIGTPLPCGIEGALTPMGAVSLQWLRETADATDADLLARAAGFFPWWEPGVHEQARVGVGRVALWQFPWHPPRDETESALADLALACLGPTPSSLGPGGALTHRDIEELNMIAVTTPDSARPPAADGFGFMRRNVKRNPFPGCTLELPGYFYEHDDDGYTKTYWFDDRAVCVGSSLVSDDAEDAPTPRELVERYTFPQPGRGRPSGSFAIDAPPLRGHCVLLEPADGESFRHAHAIVERPGRSVSLTITYADPSHAGWVEAVVRAVNVHPPEEG